MHAKKKLGLSHGGSKSDAEAGSVMGHPAIHDSSQLCGCVGAKLTDTQDVQRHGVEKAIKGLSLSWIIDCWPQLTL
jgi:hypothetical protein